MKFKESCPLSQSSICSLGECPALLIHKSSPVFLSLTMLTPREIGNSPPTKARCLQQINNNDYKLSDKFWKIVRKSRYCPSSNSRHHHCTAQLLPTFPIIIWWRCKWCGIVCEQITVASQINHIDRLPYSLPQIDTLCATNRTFWCRLAKANISFCCVWCCFQPFRQHSAYPLHQTDWTKPISIMIEGHPLIQITVTSLSLTSW